MSIDWVLLLEIANDAARILWAWQIAAGVVLILVGLYGLLKGG